MIQGLVGGYERSGLVTVRIATRKWTQFFACCYARNSASGIRRAASCCDAYCRQRQRRSETWGKSLRL